MRRSSLWLSIFLAVALTAPGVSLPGFAQSLNEQFQKAVDAGQWQTAIDLIDQIVQQQPDRKGDLEPYRQRYVLLVEVDKAFQAGRWAEAVALIDQVTKEYPDPKGDVRLKALRTELEKLAKVDAAVAANDFQSALNQMDDIIKAQNNRPDLVNYRKAIAARIPGPGKAVKAGNWTITVNQVQAPGNKSALVSGEAKGEWLIVLFSAQNGSGQETSLGATEFGAYDGEGTGYRAVGLSAEAGRGLQPLGTKAKAGTTLRSGIAFDVPKGSTDYQLVFSPAGGSPVLIRLR
ncbi:MAG: DUF4352 domain-containing protein [Cyanobacteriota bacterium]|nr:DUF4352 domain-containing protein [Cyanobacteriota bacterium]